MSNRRNHSTHGPGRNVGLPGRVRIIGGRWRGRRLPVAPTIDLRPSGDRVRETLFNWLAPHISGARCLDLFAGTGVLGFEAISRGAESATLVELNAVAAQQLSANKASLEAENIEIVHADVFQ